MSDSPKNLEDLRKEIDRLDEAIHDLLMQRVAISGSLAGAKGQTPTLRPAREMEILRRLAARHRGAMPLAGVVRIWREIMAASLALQGNFKVYLPGNGEGRALWDLARFHFGSGAPLVALGGVLHVVQELGAGSGDIGVLPEPLFEEDDPWWPHLLFAGEGGPRIVAKLPFLSGAPGYDFPPAFAVSNAMQRATGDDATLIAALTGPDFSRAKAGALFKAHGIDVRLVSLAPDGDSGRRYMLFESTGFIAEDDERLAGLQDASEDILQLKVVGGYARPIDAGALAGGKA